MIKACFADQLTENDVVNSVCQYLESDGFTIKQRLTTLQQGDDIVAARSGEMLYIEAKGATSAREASARFGRRFDSAQVRVHVAEAVYKAVQVISRPTTGFRVRAGIALPANSLHQREVATVSKLLGDLGITIFWVSKANEVTVQTHSEKTH